MRQFSAALMKQEKKTICKWKSQTVKDIPLKPIYGLKLFLKASLDQPMHLSFNKERINGLDISVESSHTSGNKSIGP